MITEKDLDLIEAYLGKSANPAQTKEVERRLQEDTTFRAQLEIMKELPSAVMTDVEGFRSDLKLIMSENKPTSQAKTRQLPLRKVLLTLAASLALMIAINFLLNDRAPTDLYASYFTLPPENISVRSNNDQSTNLSAALEAYSRNQYALANDQFKAFLANQPQHQGARFFYSLSLLADSQSTEAQANLLLLQDDPGSYGFAVTWYLGLIQLKLGKTSDALPYFTQLAEQENSYQKQAKEILKVID
jgi:TolA-binding protein